MKRYVLLLIVPFLLLSFLMKGQTIVTIPVYPSDNDSCTVIYDATKGNGELANVPPPIYAHTGVITNLSSSSSDWKHVIAGWSENTPKALMTPLGNNLYQLKLLPSIRAFYNVPAGEQILKLAFVFRNSDGSKVGRESNGGDIFYDVYPEGLSINIIQPANDHLLVFQGGTIPVKAVSPAADSMFLYVNNDLIKSIAGQTITDTLPAAGQYWSDQLIKIIAKNDTGTVTDSVIYQVIPPPAVQDVPAGIQDGITYTDSTSVILSLFAPYKNFCFVIGDFNDWMADSAFYMKKSTDGSRYWIEIHNLIPQKEYIFQYLVNGSLRIADPYTEKVIDPDDQYISEETYPGLIPYPEDKTTGAASVIQTAKPQYQWENTSFLPPKTTDLVIYELLLRDFVEKHDYQTLEDTLSYLQRLGINAIELMPVMEFEGNESWGYNPDFLFAPDKYYGTENSLKHFIDKAHSLGIAVIFDIVVNHQFGQSPLVRLYWDAQNNRPSSNSPWFNPIPKHPYNVGYDFNHESSATKKYFGRVLKYWIQDYHIDGYRFDLSKGLTQTNTYPDNVSQWGHYDAGRIAILKGYSDTIRSVKPNFILILEHFADNDEEKVLSDYGMLLWGNLNYAYSQAGKGAISGSDFSWVSYAQRNWTNPNLVGYQESHDEERTMYRILYEGLSSSWYSTRELGYALGREEMNAAFFYTVPGPKMLWQFGERGYDYSINWGGGRLSPKPPRWDYMNDWKRKRLYNTVAAIIKLRTEEDAFETGNFWMNTGGTMKTIHLNSASMNVAVAGNFGVETGDMIPQFQNTGRWYDYFSGDSLDVTDQNVSFSYLPGEYHIYTTKKFERPAFVGVSESGNADQDKIILYPNPVTSVLTIHTSLRIIKYDLFDTSGKLIKSVAGNERSINMSSLDKGLYFLRIITDNGKIIPEKVLKK